MASKKARYKSTIKKALARNDAELEVAERAVKRLTKERGKLFLQEFCNEHNNHEFVDLGGLGGRFSERCIKCGFTNYV